MMPSNDGGHYFLTAFAPIHADPCQRADGTPTSPAAAVREALAVLPTAAQSEVCVASQRTSPFSRCHRTHFARLVVIDQPAFNGRTTGNTLVEAIRKTDLLAHQPVDALTRAWLLLSIDFDAGEGPDGGLHAYLASLWDLMKDELRDIYAHCYDFTETVHDGDGFARYIERCRVETTMPFNDYWITPPPLPSLPLKAMAAGALVFVVAAVALAAARGGSGWALLALVLSIAIALWAAYTFVNARGERTWPTGPGSDLRTVLKALFLQQRFAGFAIANQGIGDEDLHRSFGEFLAANRPAEVAPTQAPGVVRS